MSETWRGTWAAELGIITVSSQECHTGDERVMRGSQTTAQLCGSDQLRNMTVSPHFQQQPPHPPIHALTQRVKLGLALSKTLSVGRVDEEDNAVDLGEVVTPETTRLQMSTEVVGREADVADRELLRSRVERRLESGKAVVLEHVKESLGR